VRFESAKTRKSLEMNTPPMELPEMDAQLAADGWRPMPKMYAAE